MTTLTQNEINQVMHDLQQIPALVNRDKRQGAKHNKSDLFQYVRWSVLRAMGHPSEYAETFLSIYAKNLNARALAFANFLAMEYLEFRATNYIYDPQVMRSKQKKLIQKNNK